MNISISEIVVILLIALLVIRPEQLPEVATTLGRFARVIRGMVGKIKGEMSSLMDAPSSSSDKSNEQR